MSLFYSAGLGGTAIPDSDLYYEINSGDNGTNSIDDEKSNNEITSDGTLSWTQDTEVRGDYRIFLDSSNQLTKSTDPNIVSDKDWSVACEIYVQSESGEQVIWGNGFNLSDGNGDQFFLAGIESGNIGCTYYDGSNYSQTPAISTPSTPYYADLHVTWDSSASDLTVYLDGTEDSGTIQRINGFPNNFFIGAGIGNSGFGNYVGAFARWNSVVPPSDFTDY